jgi:hypothetical protein
MVKQARPFFLIKHPYKQKQQFITTNHLMIVSFHWKILFHALHTSTKGLNAKMKRYAFLGSRETCAVAGCPQKPSMNTEVHDYLELGTE